jgi:hypothetical protein
MMLKWMAKKYLPISIYPGFMIIGAALCNGIEQGSMRASAVIFMIALIHTTFLFVLMWADHD